MQAQFLKVVGVCYIDDLELFVAYVTKGILLAKTLNGAKYTEVNAGPVYMAVITYPLHF